MKILFILFCISLGTRGRVLRHSHQDDDHPHGADQSSSDGGANFFHKFDRLFSLKNLWETETNMISRAPPKSVPTTTATPFSAPALGNLYLPEVPGQGEDPQPQQPQAQPPREQDPPAQNLGIPNRPNSAAQSNIQGGGSFQLPASPGLGSPGRPTAPVQYNQRPYTYSYYNQYRPQYNYLYRSPATAPGTNPSLKLPVLEQFASAFKAMNKSALMSGASLPKLKLPSIANIKQAIKKLPSMSSLKPVMPLYPNLPPSNLKMMEKVLKKLNNSASSLSSRLPGLPSLSPLPLGELFPDSACTSEEGESGSCVLAPLCVQSGGESKGPCKEGLGVSRVLQVCCIYSSACNTETDVMTSYFRNSLAATPGGARCRYRLRLQPQVCQVRLDFFQLLTAPSPDSDGVCDPNNRLSLALGGQEVSRLPVEELCGAVSSPRSAAQDSPHLYVHVPSNSGGTYLDLVVKARGAASSWNIKLTQLSCSKPSALLAPPKPSALLAPPGCSQYHTATSGSISSLNLLDRLYPPNLSLTTCIKQDFTACAIRYSFVHFRLGVTKTGGLGYGLVCKDYLSIAGERTAVCGEGDGRELVLPVRGPTALTFVSDSVSRAGQDMGFRLNYEVLRDCSHPDFKFFKYPVSK